MSKEDGGPAFPFVEPSEYRDFGTGLTIRDWFAGMALQGIVGGAVSDKSSARFTERNGIKALGMAAYNIADAMLLARKEKSDEQ